MKATITVVLLFLITATLAAQNESKAKTQYDTIKETQPGERLDTSGYTLRFDVDSFNLRIVPPSSGVRFYEGGIVFLSPVKEEQKMSASHLSFGNIQTYFATINDTATGPHQLFSPFSSSPFNFPSDALSFSKDDKTLYFTRISKSDSKEKIFRANRYTTGNDRQGWSWENQPLEFCTGSFRYTHPAISFNGDFMIFASDRTGSKGGMDLFVTYMKNGEWSSPENAGSVINTKGNEMFPFLDQS